MKHNVCQIGFSANILNQYFDERRVLMIPSAKGSMAVATIEVTEVQTSVFWGQSSSITGFLMSFGTFYLTTSLIFSVLQVDEIRL